MEQERAGRSTTYRAGVSGNPAGRPSVARTADRVRNLSLKLALEIVEDASMTPAQRLAAIAPVLPFVLRPPRARGTRGAAGA